MRRVVGTAMVLLGFAILVPTAGARVLLVGTFHGIPGQYNSIQAAVDAARPFDWILIGPGDYKTSSSRSPKGHRDFPAGVLITKRNLHIRGMNRNSVVVDGTKSGPRCSAKTPAQNFGPSSRKGRLGLNGLMVWKAANVWIENLTACNFLGGKGTAGNEIWWNGGADSGRVGGKGFYGSYLSATSTYYNGEATAAQYGIFSSNWSGGTWNQTYASNFNDSGYYIGACQRICNQTVNHAWSEFSVLGYSGSNSGGQILIENSQFDHNQDGFDTNSQNGDNPPPQDGTCPNNGTSSITHTHSCWVFMHNYVHDNNNPNVPAAGTASNGPVGTGMSVSGGRNDTIMNNTFANNNAWGVIFLPYPDNGPPCTGGTQNALGQGSCLYDEWGNALMNNTFSHNGSFGHPTNGDFAWSRFENGHPTSCFSGNVKSGGGSLTPDAAQLQQTYATCNGQTIPAGSSNPQFVPEVLCDTQVQLTPGVPAACPTGPYPRRTRVILRPLPHLPTMRNPCGGVPANPWCTRQGPRSGPPVLVAVDGPRH